MPLDMDGVRRRKQRRSGGGWKPDEGPNEVRILPPTSEYFEEDIDYIALTCNLHYFRMDSMDTQVSRCFRDDGRVCPACEMAGRFSDDEDDPALAKRADQISRAERHFFNIIDLDDVEIGIQPYQCGYTVHRDLLKYAANPKWGDFLHPEHGRDVTIELTPGSRTKSGYNEYSVQPDPDQIDRTDILPSDWLEKLDELQYAIPDYMTEDEMLRVLDRMEFPVESKRKDESGGGAPMPDTSGTPGGTSTGSNETVNVDEETTVATGGSDEDDEDEVNATSSAQILADNLDVDLADVEGTGDGGKITAGDVEAAAEGGESDAGKAHEAAGESDQAAAELGGEPKPKALDRAGSEDEIVNPPADSEDDTPWCYGDYEPDDHPCHPCGAKADCQMATLGMD